MHITVQKNIVRYQTKCGNVDNAGEPVKKK